MLKAGWGTDNAQTAIGAYSNHFCCRFSCRLSTTLSGIPRVQLRQITLSVNDLLISCRTSYSPAVA
jgi:hypothetical protein